MAVSSISDQNVKTAQEFEISPQQLQILLSVDERPLRGELHDEVWVFRDQGFRFMVHLKTIVTFGEEDEKMERMLVLDVGTAESASWELLYQVRIRVGQDEDNLLAVDQFNVDFVPGSRPVTVEVADEHILVVKLEMRTINSVYWSHPTFDEGDVTLLFSRDPPIRTWRSLLALASPYMAGKLSDSSVDGVKLGDFPRRDMEEMLFQLYPTNWPFFMNFHAVAKAAVCFAVPSLIHSVNKFLIEYHGMPTVKKWKLAMDLGLELAVQIMTYEDVRSGGWDRRIAAGFQPEVFFSKFVYQKLICPMVLAGRGITTPPVHLSDPWIQPDYFKPGPHKVPLLFRKTKFHVNQGILAVNGTIVPHDSEGFSMTFTSEMQFYCAREEVIPGKVLVAVLNSFHPGGPQVEYGCLRPALVLCHNHGWLRAKEKLEQRLLWEPSTTVDQFQEQLVFAERFGLENMLRALVLRVEMGCAELCRPLLDRSEISEKTRLRLQQRMCDAWSREPIHKKYWVVGVRKPTIQRDRVVGRERHDDHDAATLAGVDSQYAHEVIHLTAV